MDAIPQVFAAEETGRINYPCPLCKVQNTSDREDIGWVFCPMLDGQMICLGCCIDLQSVDRRDDFHEHPYGDLFDEVSQVTGKDVSSLRRICLEHQEAVILEDLINSSIDEPTKQELVQLLSQIRRVKPTIGE